MDTPENTLFRINLIKQIIPLNKALRHNISGIKNYITEHSLQLSIDIDTRQPVEIYMEIIRLRGQLVDCFIQNTINQKPTLHLHQILEFLTDLSLPEKDGVYCLGIWIDDNHFVYVKCQDFQLSSNDYKTPFLSMLLSNTSMIDISVNCTHFYIKNHKKSNLIYARSIVNTFAKHALREWLETITSINDHTTTNQ